MFNDVINTTALYDSISNDAIGDKVSGDPIFGDVSFVSTLRALIIPRMPEDGRINVFHKSIDSAYADNARDYIISTSDRRISRRNSNAFCIHNVRIYNDEKNDSSFKCIDENFCQVFSGWTKVEKVTAFFRKSFRVLCFVDKDHKSTAIFVDKLNVRKLHYIQCAIFAMIPWYFKKEDGITEEEMALINSLREKESGKYIDCITNFASKYDFRSTKIKSSLAGFETRFIEVALERKRNELSNIDESINTYFKEVQKLLKNKNDLNAAVLGLMTKLKSGDGDSSLMDYFLCNKGLYISDVNDNKVEFICKGYVSYFDEDYAKVVIDNENSYVYDVYQKTISDEDIKELMTAIFVDQTLKMKFCAAYAITLDGSLRAFREYNYGAFPGYFYDCMANPHIDAFRCMGNYEMEVYNSLNNNDYVGAVSKCLASCQSLNFSDSAVMSEFMKRIHGTSTTGNSNNRCIELPDGSVVTPKEAIDYIKQNKDGGSDE